MGYEQNKNVQIRDSSHFGPMTNPSSSETHGMITNKITDCLKLEDSSS